MEISISQTAKGVKEFPMHKHSYIEITFYPDTTGTLRTTEKSYSFFPGCTVIMPACTLHSSRSEAELNGIYIIGDFTLLSHLKAPVIIKDNKQNEGAQLVSLIINNRFANKEYLASLCNAYIHFLLTNMNFEDEMDEVINKIISKITKHAFDPDISLCDILKSSGYAEDYLRSKFKKATKKTPVSFLTDIRINHACFLIESYGKSLSLSKVAESCGYTDYVYFSKRFNAKLKISPQKYRNMITKIPTALN